MLQHERRRHHRGAALAGHASSQMVAGLDLGGEHLERALEDRDPQFVLVTGGQRLGRRWDE